MEATTAIRVRYAKRHEPTGNTKKDVMFEAYYIAANTYGQWSWSNIMVKAWNNIKILAKLKALKSNQNSSVTVLAGKSGTYYDRKKFGELNSDVLLKEYKYSIIESTDGKLKLQFLIDSKLFKEIISEPMSIEAGTALYNEIGNNSNGYTYSYGQGSQYKGD